jgi:hypothetical protein
MSAFSRAFVNTRSVSLTAFSISAICIGSVYFCQSSSALFAVSRLSSHSRKAIRCSSTWIRVRKPSFSRSGTFSNCSVLRSNSDFAFSTAS